MNCKIVFIISTDDLNRNYQEFKDGEQIQKIANPELILGSGNYLPGDYNFTSLIRGHTTQVSLDPTLSTYGNFGSGTQGGTPGNQLIGGYIIITIFLSSVLGVAIVLIRLRIKKL